MFQVIVIAFQQFYQVSRRTRLEPVTAELFIFKSIQQAERIIDPFSVLYKMITVISPLQLGAGFLIGHFLRIRQFVKFFFKIVMDFLLGHSAKSDIHFLHGNIIQIIQVTEYADLAKLGDPGKESQFDTTVHGFQYAVERFQRISVFLLQFLVADGLEHRFVVFVYKNDCTLTCLLASTLNDSGKTQRICTLGSISAIKFFPFGKIFLQYIT